MTLVSNAQIPTLVVFGFLMMVLRRPWVLWHQDVYAVAIRSFAGQQLGHGFRLVVGPFTDAADAASLCARLPRAAADCGPVPFIGQDLDQTLSQ